MISTKTLSIALAASMGFAIAGGAISPVHARPGNRPAHAGGPNNSQPEPDSDTSTPVQDSTYTCLVSQVFITGYGNANDCAGFFSGNDKGNGPGTNAITRLNDGLFGDFGSWSLAGTEDDFTGMGSEATDGTWNFAKGFSGPATVAVKAGDSYSLYFFEDVAAAYAGTFSTAGVEKVGSGNTPGLSHLSVFTAQRPGGPEPTPQPVPEPATILSLLAVGGLGIGLKRQRQG